MSERFHPHCPNPWPYQRNKCEPRSLFASMATDSDDGDEMFLTQVSPNEDEDSENAQDIYCPETSDVSEFELSQMVDHYDEMEEVDHLVEMLMCADDLGVNLRELRMAIIGFLIYTSLHKYLNVNGLLFNLFTDPDFHSSKDTLDLVMQQGARDGL